MSPLDDELRAALRGRAATVAPSPDPLAGIERRASQLRRNKIAATVAGSALAVAAIAAVVPALQSTGVEPRTDVRVAASSSPTAAPQTSAYVLDPERPWAFRGTPVDEGSRATIEREYATRTGAAEVELTPLFAQVYEPSQQLEVVFLAQVDGSYRWGVAQSSEAGPEFVWEEALPDDAQALAAALPGDEVARLLVVASPQISRVEYAPDGAGQYSPLAQLEPGVGVAPLEGDAASDTYRVIGFEGQELVSAPAPDPQQVEQPADGGQPPVVPAGYGWDTDAPWDSRGVAEPQAANIAVEDERLFTAKHGEGWTTRPLYAADSDAGVSVLFVLHTKQGQPALVSTTWVVGDAAGQVDQVVEPGQALVQASVPTAADGERLLVALASPKAGGIVLTGPGGNRPDGAGDPGVGLWSVDAGEEATVRVYTEGDGVEYAAEPARTS